MPLKLSGTIPMMSTVFPTLNELLAVIVTTFGATDGWKAITSASRTSNVVTITASNSLSGGNTVLIIGIVPDSFNGIYTVASRTSTNFTYSNSGSNQTAKHVGSFAVSLEHDRVASDIETLCAGGGNDYLIGNDLENKIKGLAGNDSMRGGANPD